MKKNLLFRLCLMMSAILVLFSCIHDEVYTSSDPSSTEYTNKSLWKQDEKYIENVMKVYAENEAEIKKANGSPFWNYSTTVNSFDESYVAVPIVDNGKVTSVLKVPRHGKKIYFYYTQDQEELKFFQALIFAEHKKEATPDLSEPQTEGLSCTRQAISVWLPDDESAPNGSGHWSTISYIKCVQVAENCVGVVNANGVCEGGSGSGGGYDYPGGEEEEEEEEEEGDPCARTKATTTDPKFVSSINTLKNNFNLGRETGYTLSNGAQPQFLDSPLGSTEVKFTFYPTTYAFTHVHFDGIYPIFSPGDIIEFNKWIVKAKAWNDIPTNNPKINLNNLSYTVVTSWGNYTMTYDGMGATPFQNFTKAQIDDLNLKYENALSNAITIGASGPSYNMEKLEKEFMKFIGDKLNMLGLKLFKVENNSNTELFLLKGNRRTNPCPN